MGLSKGWFRLCVFATALWVVAVAVLLVVEYFDQGMNCEFGPWVHYGGVERCSRVLWYWKENVSDIFTRTYYVKSEQPIFYWPDLTRILLALVIGPAALWSLASGVAWVRRGFAPQS